MRRLILSFFLSFGLVQGAQAQSLSASQQEILQEVNAYFQTLQTVSSGFVQVSSTGDFADGIVHLSRPDEKMRLVYNPPNKTELIVRNDTIIYHDKEYDQVTYYPLNSTPLAALVKSSLDFSKDVRVIDVAQQTGVIEVTVIDPDDEALGSVTLVFSDKPLMFRKWHVLDAQGTTTQVTLINPQINHPLDRAVFDFTAPKNR